MLFPLLEPAFAPPPSLPYIPSPARLWSHLVWSSSDHESRVRSFTPSTGAGTGQLLYTQLLNGRTGSWEKRAGLGAGRGCGPTKPREGGTHRDVELDGLAIFEA